MLAELALAVELPVRITQIVSPCKAGPVPVPTCLGDIVADNVALGGNSGITMDLNTTTAFSILKASLFQ